MSRGTQSSGSSAGFFLAVAAFLALVIYLVLRKWADQLGLTVEIVFWLGLKGLAILALMGFAIHADFCRVRSTLPAAAAAVWFAFWPAIDKWGTDLATKTSPFGYDSYTSELPFWTDTWFKAVVFIGIIAGGYVLIHWWDER